MDENLTGRSSDESGVPVWETTEQPAPEPGRARHRPSWRAVAVVAAVVVVVAAVGLVLSSDRDPSATVATDDDQATTTTTTTGVSVEDPSPETTATNAVPVEDTVPETPTSTAPALTPPATSPTSAPPTTTPAASADPEPITGTAVWHGSDPRAFLRIGACPSAEETLGCPPLVTAPVAPDGSFVLIVPGDQRQWQVAAYVSTMPSQTCVFVCQWEKHIMSAIRSEVATVDLDDVQPLAFSVTARVVDVVARDRYGNPFPNGGLMIFDHAFDCPSGTCPDGTTGLLYMTSPTDGATRVVVDPDVTYEFVAMAHDLDWPEEPWMSPTGNPFWFSDKEIMTGAGLDEGHLFTVQAGPAS
jgi:hypothetical protein